MNLISERPLPAHQVDHGQATACLLKARGKPPGDPHKSPSISYIFQLFVFSFWNKNKLLLLFLFLCSWWAGWLVALKSTGILQIWKSGKEMGDSCRWPKTVWFQKICGRRRLRITWIQMHRSTSTATKWRRWPIMRWDWVQVGTCSPIAVHHLSF